MGLLSNISSLSAQRRLTQATESLSRSFERLSSGMRINRASDDAAGLAIADSLRTDTRLYSSAIRNVSDGISAINIASGALQNQNDILTRLFELSEQSANGTLSDTQRDTMNKEYQSLLREFGRIGDTTSFNRVNLLLGGRGTNLSQLLIQAGITGNSNSSIGISLSDSGSLSGTVNAEGASFFFDPFPEEYSFDQITNVYQGEVLRSSVVDSSGRSHDILLAFQAKNGTIQVNTFIRANESDGTVGTDVGMWVDAGNGTGGTYNTATGKVTGTGFNNAIISNFANGATANLSLDLRGLTFRQIGSSANINVVEFTGIETQSSARSAFSILSQRMSDLGSLIGAFGATQSRLETSLKVLQAQRENTAAAESRIRDVDVASESAQLVASQIRQQVGVQILSLANQEPRLLLDLLRG